MKAAFFKGTRPGIAGVYNALGRALDHGPYSHTEMLLNNGYSASSSFLDHGVRIKYIGYSSVNNWDFIQVPDRYNDAAEAWAKKFNGTPYDVLGNLRFFCGFVREHPRHWFCSESNLEMLGDVSQCYRFGPNGMALLMLDRIASGEWDVPWPDGIAIMDQWDATRNKWS